jgi:hypothetical protein
MQAHHTTMRNTCTMQAKAQTYPEHTQQAAHFHHNTQEW